MKKEIKQLDAYVPEEPLADLQRRLNLDRVVRLSANENPYGTSEKVAEMLSKMNFSANQYPDGAATALRTAVSDFYQVPAEQLVFGCGLDEVISLINRTFLTAGDEVVVSVPTFSEYILNAKIEGAKVVEVRTDSKGQMSFAAMLAAITQQTKIIWICNPNNPTGTYESKQAIREFVQSVPDDVLVVIDEAYLEYVTDEQNPSAIDLITDFSNVVVLKTFSKAYGLANFRVGFGVFSKQLADYVQSVRLPYNLNSLSQAAARIALSDQAFIRQTVEKTIVERNKWFGFLDDREIQYDQSQTNFIFFTLSRATDLAEVLLQQGYIVRTGLLPNWIRLTIGEPTDNQNIQKIIDEFLKLN